MATESDRTDRTDRADRVDGAGPGVRRGKSTRRTRCRVCGAPVLADREDGPAKCDSCSVQRGLFPVGKLRRR